MANRKENYRKFYAVYLRETDELLCAGSSAECMSTMGMTYPVFKQTVSKVKAGVNRKYEIYVEDWDNE